MAGVAPERAKPRLTLLLRHCPLPRTDHLPPYEGNDGDATPPVHPVPPLVVLDPPPADDLTRRGATGTRLFGTVCPPRAHAATKRIVRGYLQGGVDEADRVTPGQFADLFATEDLRNAVRTFLREGPGKAKFEGR